MARSESNGLDLIELPVAFDGLSVVVNRDNSWVDYLTVAELRKIWQPGSSDKRGEQTGKNKEDQRTNCFHGRVLQMNRVE